MNHQCRDGKDIGRAAGLTLSHSVCLVRQADSKQSKASAKFRKGGERSGVRSGSDHSLAKQLFLLNDIWYNQHRAGELTMHIISCWEENTSS